MIGSDNGYVFGHKEAGFTVAGVVELDEPIEEADQDLELDRVERRRRHGRHVACSQGAGAIGLTVSGHSNQRVPCSSHRIRQPAGTDRLHVDRVERDREIGMRPGEGAHGLAGDRTLDPHPCQRLHDGRTDRVVDDQWREPDGRAA